MSSKNYLNTYPVMLICKISLSIAPLTKHINISWCKKGAKKTETNQDIGLSRGGRNTKIYAVVDALENPVKLYFTPGNIHDCTVVVDVLEGLPLVSSVVMGDKAYGTVRAGEFIESNGGSCCIPPLKPMLLSLGIATFFSIRNAM